MSSLTQSCSRAIVACLWLLPACGDDETNDGNVAPGSEVPSSSEAQIHVTVAIHLEPDNSYRMCGPNNYERIRANVVSFVGEVVARGAALNIQSDDTFFEGMAACESDVRKTDTDGLDLGAWIVAQPNVEVDAHKEGGNEMNPQGTGPDNTLYADVHALATAVVPEVTNVVGGFIWQNSDQVAQFREESGVEGILADSPVWQAQILTLAVGEAHHMGNFADDDFSTGLWRPAGSDGQFTESSDTGPVYIGPGLQHSDWNDKCQYGFRSASDYSQALLTMIDRGDLPNGFYTATIATPQSAVKADPGDTEGKYQAALQFIDDVNLLRATDARVQWSTYTQVVDHWTSEADGVANRIGFSEISTDLHTCSP